MGIVPLKDQACETAATLCLYEELRLQFENQQRVLSDYEAKLSSRDQV